MHSSFWKREGNKKNLLVVLVENLDLEILERFFAEKTKKTWGKTGGIEERNVEEYVTWLGSTPHPSYQGCIFSTSLVKNPNLNHLHFSDEWASWAVGGRSTPHSYTWHNRELVERPWQKLASNGVGHEENLGKIFLISSLRAPNKGHLSTDLHLKHQNKKIHSGKLTWNHRNVGLVQMMFLLKCSLFSWFPLVFMGEHTPIHFPEILISSDSNRKKKKQGVSRVSAHFSSFPRK